MSENNITTPEIRFSLIRKPDGVIVGPDPQHGYWGELNQEEFQNLHDLVKMSANFDLAVQKFFYRHQRKDLYPYLTDLVGRSSWYRLFDQISKISAVDLGAGLGAISEFLSSQFQRVYSVEGCLGRCEFLSTRFKKKNLNNIYVIHNSVRNLPFNDDSIDLVVCNGVLEWVGVGSEGPVKDAQVNFLSEIRRVLKDDGILYIGIENRFGYVYFKGGLDHTGTRYTSLMPRWMATLVLMRQCIKGRHNFWFSLSSNMDSYRTYTYSVFGYRKLLKYAGLKFNIDYCVEPSYDIPRYGFPFSLNRKELADFTNLFLQKKISYMQQKYMCSNFYIFASRKDLKQAIKSEPVFFGYKEILKLGNNCIERHGKSGEVLYTKIIKGKNVLDSHYSEISTDRVIEAYEHYLLDSPGHVAKDHQLSLREMAELISENLEYIKDLEMILENIKVEHSELNYHGDFWIGNLLVNEQSHQAYLLDPECQFFGSRALDIMDFIIDFTIHKRQSSFPLVSTDVLANHFSLKKNNKMLKQISIFRQILRYSPFNRSNALCYYYLDFLNHDFTL